MQNLNGKITPFNPDIKWGFYPLLLLSIICLILLFVNQININKTDHPQKGEMINTSVHMQKSIEMVRLFFYENYLKMNPGLDPSTSGLIGVEFSPITTTLGDISAKQTSISPDFAALFTKWMYSLNLQRNQKVVIHASASFPALIISAIIACESYGVEPIILSSAGSSSFGANRPEFTYWDLENLLYKKGMINHLTQYATPGGQNDNGSSFWENGLEIVQQSAKKNNHHLHVPASLKSAIEQKLQYIQSSGEIGLFINIGGNHSALGDNSCASYLPAGLITGQVDCKAGQHGLVHLMNNKNIPVIHMLNIEDIALKNGLFLEPNIEEQAGRANLYFILSRPKWLVPSSLALLIILSIIIIYHPRFHRIHHISDSSKTI